MAEKRDDNMGSDSGLGNLPPLSDFDSTTEEVSDSGLPPLGTFDSAPGTSPLGGLPPIDQLKEEIPKPGGGAIKPAPPGFTAQPPLDSSSGELPAGMGFQDLAVDSDFSPETPDIGPGPSPGPSSGLDTPNLFDSAFGGDDFGVSPTPAPTQAMETPMFGSAGPPTGGGMSFEPDAFDGGAFGGGRPAGGSYGGGMAFDSGTPAPDFSPDTELQQAMPMATPAEVGGKKKAKGGSPVLALVMAIVGLIGGVVAAPYIPLDFLPNPAKQELELAKAEIVKQKAIIDKYEQAGPKEGQTSITPEERDKLRSDIQDAQKLLNDTKSELETRTGELADLTAKLEQRKEEVELKNEEYEKAQTTYQALQDQTYLMEARLRGLDSEVERLSGFVGDLEAANQRRIVSKDALLHSLDRLIVQVQESLPLTPEKFSHQSRLQAVEALRKQVDSENWVTPELLNAYTDLYLGELRIAAAQEYFFASLPLIDRYGNRSDKWAECVMEGNQAVYYRSLDGLNAGVYRNGGTAETPAWQFYEEIEPERQEMLAARIAPYRVKGYEQKVQLLTGQEAQKEKTPISRVFSSL